MVFRYSTRPSPAPLLLVVATTLLLLASPARSQTPPEILVYSRTAGFRHDSIPTAIDALRTIGESTNLFTPTFSEDPALFTTEQLAKFSAIAFLSNSDEVLDAGGQAAFQEWLTGGGGLIGLHAATACLFENQAFGVAMGSWFDYHPDIQSATFTKLVSHPTIDMLPDRYTYVEEVYNFRSDPRDVNATVLLTVDPTSYTDAQIGTRPYSQGTPHPIAWLRDSPVDLGNGTGDGVMTGRLWMTSLGHTNATWESSLHLEHVTAGIKWVLEGTSLAVNGSSPTTTRSSGGVSAANTASSTSSAAGAAATPSTASSAASSRMGAGGFALGAAGIAAMLM